MAKAPRGEVEFRYTSFEGEDVVTTLDRAPVEDVVRGLPVRTFGSHAGMGHYPGWWWSATTSAHVGYESLLERDRILLADFDVAVTAIASQPFWVNGLDEDVRRQHAPDYFLVCADGSVIVVDVKPAAMCEEPKVAAVLGWTGRLCRDRGWRYEVFHGGDPVVMANLRFLAQGRRSMFLDEECIAAVAAAGRPGMTLGQIETQVEGCDPLDARASVMALLWRQTWMTDLSRPLSSSSVITVPAEEERCRAAS